MFILANIALLELYVPDLIGPVRLEAMPEAACLHIAGAVLGLL